MRRLLWKEWHELRWYVIAMVFIPWVVLSPVFAGDIHRDLFAVDVQMLMLVLLFWGASRMREDMQTHFPVSRLQMLAVKLLPGLVMAVLFPYWIRFVAVSKGLMLDNEPLTWLAYAVSLYMVSFAFSLFASTIASVLAAWFTIFSGGPIFETLARNYDYSYRSSDKAIIYLWLAGTAFLTITGMCLIVRHNDARRRAAIILIFLALALPTMLIIRNGHREEVPLAPYDSSYADNARILASPDRRMFAYAESNSYLDEVKIRDAHGVRTILKRNGAAPTAWLSDGNLLIIATDTGLDTQFLEWNHKSGVLSYLIRFSNNKESRQFDMPSIYRAIPSPDGAKIALVTESETGYGDDLWMLDRRSRKLKLAHPGMYVDWDGNEGFSWDGDRLVFNRGDRYWSIRSDGSDLKRIPCL